MTRAGVDIRRGRVSASAAMMPSANPNVKMIVLTGGPGAGKTSAASEVARRLSADGTRTRHVPEAATQVYTRLGRKWNQLTIAERRRAQAAMYELQLEQESAALKGARFDATRVLILDRGTIDGAGYWPDGDAAFWEAVGTTQAAELSRYHAVVWLETAAKLGLYDHDASNEVRFEDAEGAIAAGEVQARLWGGHPRVVRVGAQAAWEAKLNAVTRAVRELLGPATE